MDDPQEKELPELQKLVSDQVGNNCTNNSSLKFRIKIPVTRNGFSRVVEGKEKEKETHVDEKNRNYVELRNCFQKLKNQFPTSSMEEKKNHTEVNSERTTCYVCGKNFQSEKSLHGHMRSHPKRPWRGIVPPSISDSIMCKIDNDQEQNSSSSSESSDIDRIRDRLLHSWSVTGLRGRKSKVQRKRDEKEVVGALLMLPGGNSLDLANQDYIVRTRDTVGTLVLANVENNEEVLENSDLRMKRRKEGLLTENSEFQSKKAKIDKENENEMIPELVKMDSRFKCSICNKSFSSYQALGGHKSGHKNDKSDIHYADVEKLTHFDESQKFSPSTSQNIVGTHQCKICNKSFPSGQALGGHQRLHRPIPAVAPINSVSTSKQIVKGSPACSVSSPENIMKESSISSVTPPEKLIEESSSPEIIILQNPSMSSVALLEEASCKTDGNRMVFDLNELPPLDYDCFNSAE